ncbi:MAG: hypothetical protein AB7O57_09200 [Hyphomicrobiaceae bacterium]
MSLLSLGYDLMIAVIDTAAGSRRRRWEHGIDIRAPRAIVWQLLKSRDVTFEGRFPLRVVAEPVTGEPGLERVHVLAGPTRLEMLTRIVDERPGEAILYELLAQGTDPALVEGDDDFIGFVLLEVPAGTRLDLMRETSPRHWLSRLTVPLGLRTGARRYKRKAESMALEAAGSLPPGGAAA